MENDYKKLILDLKDFEPFRATKRTRIDENVRRAAIENDALEQDIKLKKNTLFVLFGFLVLETFAIFLFSYFQATTFRGFILEEWSFKLLVFATISQITYMLQVAVKHLFPNK
jgi:hypothetical protein